MLDPSLVSLTYLDEGAANIVYRISASPSASPTRSSHHESYSRTTPPPSEIDPPPIRPSSSNPFPGQLLRLRKDNATAAVLDSHHHFNNRIAPLLPTANLIQQTLVRASSHLIQKCNAGLRAMEKRGARSPQRAGVYLAEGEAFAVLVTDMSSSNSSSDPDAPIEAETESLSIEFKPKWLAQSPNAPSNGTSRRCRTCALRALRESRGPMPGDEKLLSSGSGFCPLKLMEQDRSIVREVGNRIVELNRIRKEDRSWMEETLFAWLYGNALLARLRTLQVVMDPEGVLMGNLESPDFLTAMTMRDCTLFLRVCVMLFLLLFAPLVGRAHSG